MDPKKALIILIVGLLALAYIQNTTGWYDHDEFSHYVSLKSMNVDYVYNPWQRGGFKLLYMPFSFLGLDGIRLVNILFIAAGCYLLFLMGDIFLSVIFLTFPLVQQVGARYYSEIPVMLLMILAMFLLYKQKLFWFALVLSFLPLIRNETVLFWLPAAWILRKNWKHLLVLPAFPVLYYLSSVAVYGSFAELFERYGVFSFDREAAVHPKGPWDHYLKQTIGLGGLWALFAFPGLVNGIRDKFVASESAKQQKAGKRITDVHKDLHCFMAVSALLIILLLSLSYWELTAFGRVSGPDRHLLIIAPMMAYFAWQVTRKYQGYLIVLAVAVVLALPRLGTTPELELLDKACQQVRQGQYGTLYTQHAYANYRLNKPFEGPDVSRLDDVDQARSGDILLWDSHYGTRKAEINRFATIEEGQIRFDKGWEHVWSDRTGNFIVLILRKS